MGNAIVATTNEMLIQEQENYINGLYKSGDFEACYDSCNYLLKLLPKGKEAQKKTKKFCYLRQAVCLKRLGKLNEAKIKGDMAKRYCGKDDRYSILHLQATIHKEKGENKQAAKLINKCIKWYKLNNMHYELGMMYAIKGELVKSESILQESIKQYNQAFEEGNYFDKDMLIKEIDYAYERLIELYVHIGEQNMIKAYKAYKMLQTEEVQKTSHRTITDFERRCEL